MTDISTDMRKTVEVSSFEKKKQKESLVQFDRGIHPTAPTVSTVSLLDVEVLCKYIHYTTWARSISSRVLLNMRQFLINVAGKYFPRCIFQTLTSLDVSPPPPLL